MLGSFENRILGMLNTNIKAIESGKSSVSTKESCDDFQTAKQKVCIVPLLGTMESKSQGFHSLRTP